MRGIQPSHPIHISGVATVSEKNMSDKKGDPEKKRANNCADFDGIGVAVCPHLKEVGGGFEGEFYECAACGERYKLYYEDMA